MGDLCLFGYARGLRKNNSDINRQRRFYNMVLGCSHQKRSQAYASTTDPEAGLNPVNRLKAKEPCHPWKNYPESAAIFGTAHMGA